MEMEDDNFAAALTSEERARIVRGFEAWLDRAMADELPPQGLTTELLAALAHGDSLPPRFAFDRSRRIDRIVDEVEGGQSDAFFDRDRIAASGAADDRVREVAFEAIDQRTRTSEDGRPVNAVVLAFVHVARRVAGE